MAMLRFFISILLFTVIFLVFVPQLVHSIENETIYDFRYLSKVHITSIKNITIPCKKGFEYIKIPNEANDVKINNSLNISIDYDRYSSQNKSKLSNYASSYCGFEINVEMAMPNEMFDTVILNFRNQKNEINSVVIFLSYDIPQITKSMMSSRNMVKFLSFNDPLGKITIILPVGNRPWEANPDNYDEKDGSLFLSWNKTLDNSLTMTYGSDTEYLFQGMQKNNILNNFATWSILILTIIISIVLSKSKEDRFVKKLDAIFIFYASAILVLSIILIYNSNLIPPFNQELRNEIFISYLALLGILFVTWYFLMKYYLK